MCNGPTSLLCLREHEIIKEESLGILPRKTGHVQALSIHKAKFAVLKHEDGLIGILYDQTIFLSDWRNAFSATFRS